jgi:hypothetical protein
MATSIPVKLVLVLAAVVVAACNAAPEASPPAQARGAPRPASSEVLRFTREINGSRQSLEVRRRDASTLDVTIAVAGACSRTEAGVAKAVKEKGDGDVEVDPDGEGHPTDAFVLTLQGMCRVAVRLAAPERDYAWLRESDCASACPLSNRAMVRK